MFRFLEVNELSWCRYHCHERSGLAEGDIRIMSAETKARGNSNAEVIFFCWDLVLIGTEAY
jgi:hypothetical protein